jgi:hypothetical protein
MKGIPNRQKKSVVPRPDYVRSKQELLRREAMRRAQQERARQARRRTKSSGGEDGTPAN